MHGDNSTGEGERGFDPRNVTPMRAALAPIDRPRDRGVANRIRQVESYPGTAGDTTGCCPSCFGSGFVHARRAEGVGVLANNETGALIRCDCPKGESIRELDRKGKQK